MKTKYLEVGKIVGTFGIKGELKLFSESDFIEERLAKGNTLYLKQGNNYIPVTIDKARFHKNLYMIAINGLTDINDVLQYVGFSLYVDTENAKALEEGEYYCDDLIGMEVYNQDNELLGEVVDVLEIPTYKLLEVKSQEKKFLVPFIDEFIKDIVDEKIIIHEIEGLR
ncbi:MAG: ribosome maturation factor RimM [Bacilli bacterium]|nr:ribosome maturation factor RimM [Bacilli bacterium]